MTLKQKNAGYYCIRHFLTDEYYFYNDFLMITAYTFSF